MSPPVGVSVDTRITTTLIVKNFRGVIEDMISGDFNQEVMKVESKSIPIITSNISIDPSLIRGGINCEGTTAYDVDQNPTMVQDVQVNSIKITLLSRIFFAQIRK